MKRTITGIILSVILLCTTAFAEKVYDPFPVSPDAFSAAYETGNFSSMLNPVFTNTGLAPDIAYRYINIDGYSTHLSLLTILGFSLQYSWYDAVYDYANGEFIDANAAIFSINRGFILGNVLGFGIGYSAGITADEGYDGYSGWNAGIMFRPFSFLSFGMSFRDIFGEMDGSELEMTGVYSMAIRPFGDRFTLSADCITGSALNDGDIYYSFSAEIKAWNYITFSFRGDTLQNYTAGITLPLDMRFSSPVNFAADLYGSTNSEGADFYSAGAAIRFRRGNTSAKTFSDNLLYVKLHDSWEENPDRGIFAEKKPEFLAIVNGIMRASDDPSIHGMILDIGNIEPGFAQIQELRRALIHFRESDKTIYVMMNANGNREYYLASCGDKIYFPPNSEFAITGLSVHVYFFKGLLDMIGIKYESIRRGDYKSFNEPFTRNEMSPEAKANLKEILAGLNEQFISGITERKQVSRDKVKELYAAGFYTPDEAREKGFIDEVMYCEDMIDSFSKKYNLVNFESYCEEETIADRWGGTPGIAVIYVSGTIIDGTGDGRGGTTGNRDYAAAIEAAFSDPGIKGVVIRINSGGGSAMASDFMWQSLVYYKKKFNKPVVFSFGNTAASGGYYIACTGDTIFAEQGTITGSIGVIAGKISAKELYAKLGISRESITMSEFADLFDESRPLTEKEFKLLDKQVGFIYGRFTQKVIEARKIPADRIDSIAGGRIHTGSGAKEKGLVDEIGGLYVAIEYCRTEAGIDGEFRIIQLPQNSSFMPGLGDIAAGSSLGPLDAFLAVIRNFELSDEEVLYLEPYMLVIE